MIAVAAVLSHVELQFVGGDPWHPKPWMPLAFRCTTVVQVRTQHHMHGEKGESNALEGVPLLHQVRPSACGRLQ